MTLHCAQTYCPIPAYDFDARAGFQLYMVSTPDGGGVKTKNHKGGMLKYNRQVITLIGQILNPQQNI